MNVEITVALEIGEHDAEAVAEPHDLEPGLPPYLAKLAVALVQEQEIPATREGVREPKLGLGNPVRLVDVAADDEVGQAVAVEIPGGGARMPAEHADGGVLVRLGELLAVVPEQRAAVGAGHVQVGVAVAVEIGRNATLAPKRHAGARLLGDVGEPALPVSEEPRRRQPAARLPFVALVPRVAVHDEEVEPAVAVVVEPAEPAARHRGRIRGLVPAECPVPEPEADLSGDVDEREIARLRRRPGRRTGYRTR